MDGGDIDLVDDGPVELVLRYGRLVDTPGFVDRDAVALFASEVTFEFPRLLGGEPARLSRPALLAWLRRFYGTFSAVEHVFTSHRARVEGGVAEVHATFHATHQLGAEHQQGWPATWVYDGALEVEAVEGSRGWRLRRLCLTIANQRGEAGADVALALAGPPATAPSGPVLGRPAHRAGHRRSQP
jgi:hypothetical protein